MRTIVAVAIALGAVAGRSNADQPPLSGRLLVLANPVPANPNRRELGFALESRSATVVGDPAANGVTIDVTVEGASSANQVFVVPPGAFHEPKGPGWTGRSRGTRARFTYTDERGQNGAIVFLRIQGLAGHFRLKARASAQGNNDPIDLVPPNPGTHARVRVMINGGDTYCAGFGGAAGGRLLENDAELFKIVRARNASCQ